MTALTCRERVLFNFRCVAIWRDEHVEIISNDQGNRTTPSYVAFSDSGRLIGEAALSQASLNPVNTVYGTKRLIGLRSDDARVESDARYFPFDIFDKDGKPYIRVTYRGEQKELSPEEISAMVLSKMKHTAETYLQTTVSDAVITVPAYFNNAQREATKDAAAISGLRVRRVLSEPTAAALAYGLERGTEMGSGEHTVIVFDLGGGTCDVSLLVLECNIFEVIAIAGTTHLGGEDFDNRLVEYFMNQFRDKHHKGEGSFDIKSGIHRSSSLIDLSTSPRAVRRLRTACERAKRTLSSATVASIEIESLFEGIDFFTTLTRARFEDLCHDLFQQTLTLVERVLQDSGRDKGQIEEIILSGGSTRIPRVAELLSEFFDGKEPKKGINPDEAVAAGAAIQAAILGGSQAEKLADLLLLDITPLSLGVRGTDDVMQTLIKRNTILPSLRLEDFTTFKDNQHEVDLWIYEGESPRASDNNLLGKYTLAPIPPSPAGVPHFTVRFDIDTNGILKVSAFDATAPETAKDVTVTNAEARLLENDIKRMTTEAQQYQAEDDAQAARIASRNELEDLAFKLRDFIDTGIGVDSVIDNIAEIKATIDRTISWPERFPSATVKEYIEKLLELERLVNSDANVIPTGNSGKEIQAANTTPDGFSFPANSEHIGNIELELDNSSLEQRQESTIPFSEVVDQADVLMYDADENSNQVTFIDTLPLLCNIIREERLRIRLQNLGGDHAQVMIEYLHFLLIQPSLPVTFPWLRKYCRVQLYKLCKATVLYPRCYTLKKSILVSGEQVAAGGFSDIYKGFFGGKELSVKAIRIYERGDTDKLLKEFAKEIVLWAYLQHENILPFYGAYYLSESRRRICLVSPWMRRGNIVDYMKRHALAPHSRALLIHEVCDVVAGLRYLHLQDMIHGDIKGANILVDERERACIMDFGLSRIRTDQTLINSLPSSSIKGYTPRYAAYEILNNNPPTFATDIWALGCVSYQIMTGNAPFPGIVKEEPVKIARAMLDGQRPIDPLPDPSNLSQEEIIIWEQIDSCCQKEVEQRPDCDHIFRKFESAGISRVDDDTRSAQEDAYWQRRVFWDAMKDGEEDPLDLSLVDSILRGLGN
ncbi:hypothetical protein NP233_g9567 [Leucocoprinus birnbaumii]|uniref:non-chaperonin molecular chaperone ATPase n=1 Tax=Leucocoprinus birnbaumii TaxID=56174 RepID=A0AAD5VKU1_9AGAR|nr:hypothetical protein NP233_g9567 [Leucocoprinus birnbaumii]